MLHILHPVAPAKSCPQELADDIRQRTGIDVLVEEVRDRLISRAVSVSLEAALVVLPSVRRNPLREWIMGTPAERLIRLCRAPVLVVKRTALSSYRRVLVPVDVQGEGASLIAMAASLSRGPTLHVLHAVSVRDEGVLRDLEGSGPALGNYRQHRAQRARQGMHELIREAGADGRRALAHVDFGDPVKVLLARQRACDAELLVMGKRQRGLLADYFLGGVTQRVLERSAADVLVLPSAARRAPAPAAASHERARVPAVARP